MRDLRELGFGPPDLGVPPGRCPNGHLWVENYVDGECKACSRMKISRAYRARKDASKKS